MTRRRVRWTYKRTGEFAVCYVKCTRNIRVERFSKHCLPISHAATASVFTLNPQKDRYDALRLVDIHKPHASTVVILIALYQFVGIHIFHDRFNGIIEEGVVGLALRISAVTLHHTFSIGSSYNLD